MKIIQSYQNQMQNHKQINMHIHRPFEIKNKPYFIRMKSYCLCVLLVIPFLVQMLALPSMAYIPPTKMILQKTAENSGTGVHSIEQIVEFQTGSADSLIMKEVWVVENAHNMKLTVTSEKLASANSSFKIQNIYTGGIKWHLMNRARESIKIPGEFLQKYFHYKQADSLSASLIKEKILPAQSLGKKQPAKTSQDIVHDPEPWVRLGRVGSTIDYAFGTPSSGSDYLPGAWIEQDLFVIRKLRFGSHEDKARGDKYIEVVADNYREFSKGLYYPEKQVIRWGNNVVTIKLISVKPLNAKNLQFLQPATLEATHMEALQTIPNSGVVEEFYSRFR